MSTRRKTFTLTAIAGLIGLCSFAPAEAGPRTDATAKGALIGAGFGLLLSRKDGAVKGAVAGSITGNLGKS